MMKYGIKNSLNQIRRLLGNKINDYWKNLNTVSVKTKMIL